MNASSHLTIGFVPVARPTFDIPLATSVTDRVRLRLVDAGFTLIGPQGLVTSLEDAAEAAHHLAENPPDLLLVFQATFADSTMVMQLVETVDAPILLWAIPEAPTGGRLRLNSLCGINLDVHALTRAGFSYNTIYAPPDDTSALNTIHTLALAGHVRRRLQHTRIGRIGTHPDGFETCIPHPAALKTQIGLELVQLELATVFDGTRSAAPAQIDAVQQQLHSQLDGLDTVDQGALRSTLATYVTLRDLAERDHLDGFAVRCWPQFFTELGCAACGALSLLTDERTPCSCETDVNGTVTQLILQWLSGETAFGSDIVSFDMDANTAVFWHCGKAPLSMADPTVKPRATIHSNRQMPLLMEFPLKPGRVTLARLSEATGQFRLVIGSGDVLQAPISFTGTSGVVRFDRPARDVLDTILAEGLEHHLAMTYGDHVDALLALARMLDLPVLCL